MITKFSRLQVGLRLASVLMLAACSGVPYDRAAEERAAERARIALEKKREHELQRIWRGQSFHTLLQTYGRPMMIMNVPGYRPVRTSVVVYGVQDPPSKCVDAFTVVVHGSDNQETVADYFCR